MELCNGGDILERIQNQKFFNEQHAKSLFRQIISAVYYCHLNNIIHRDLKLDNFLFESKESNSNIKLTDFGLSKWIKTIKGGKMKRLNSRVGTPYYIAPEVLDGNYNCLCDVWSCGVILYILLSGYPPFAGENDNEIFQNISQMKFTFEGTSWDGISNEAKDLILKMICKEGSRLTSGQVLEHSWLSEERPSQCIKDASSILKRFRNFSYSMKLQKVLLFYLATQINDIEVAKIKQLFIEIDLNNDGKISYEEFEKAIKGIYKL